MKRQQASPVDLSPKRLKSSSSSIQQPKQEKSNGSNSNSNSAAHHQDQGGKNILGHAASSSTLTPSTAISLHTNMDLDSHCGVPLAFGGRCLNSLSCATHKLSEKNLVQGRSATVKILLARNIPDRVYDDTEHCGVIINDIGPCTRALSCHFHTITEKRAVTRRVHYDTLVDLKKREKEAKKAQEELQENRTWLNHYLKFNNIEDAQNAEEEEEVEDVVYPFVP